MCDKFRCRGVAPRRHQKQHHVTVKFEDIRVNVEYQASLQAALDSPAQGNIPHFYIQSTLVISNSKGLTETLRDIHTSTYQS